MMDLKQKRQESDVDTVRRLLFDRSSVDSVQISSAAIPCLLNDDDYDDNHNKLYFHPNGLPLSLYPPPSSQWRQNHQN